MLKFNSILDLIRAFPNEQSCIDYLTQLRWKNGVISPFDSTSKVYKCKNNRWKCSKTKRYFNARTNTIFEGSKISLQNWFIAIYLYTSHKRGISSYQLARDLDVTQKTAWFILQRLRYATEHESFQKEFEGIVQCDESYCCNGKEKNKHRNKRISNSQGRSLKGNKKVVFGMLEKSTGFVKAMIIPDTKAKTIKPLLYKHVKQDSHVMSDQWYAYRNIGNYFHTHTFVNHAVKQYVNGDTTTNAIECFWSYLSRTITGVYFKISKQHLNLYLMEATFRYNTKELRTDKRFEMYLEKTQQKRLTWQSLTAKT